MELCLHFTITYVKLFPRPHENDRTPDWCLDQEDFLGGFVSKPDPAKPLAAAWYYAKEPERGQRLFVFLPGRRTAHPILSDTVSSPWHSASCLDRTA